MVDGNREVKRKGEGGEIIFDPTYKIALGDLAYSTHVHFQLNYMRFDKPYSIHLYTKDFKGKK